MNRRAFIALATGAVLATPRGARAQQRAMPVIGFVNSAALRQYSSSLRAFHKGLEQADYVEGRNVAVEYRWADGQYDRLPGMAAELVQRQVDVIVANGPAVLFVRKAAPQTPIVFTAGFDPIALGLVSSLSKPGGNLTGVSILNSELAPKRLELLREILPKAKTVGLLVNSANPNAGFLDRAMQVAAQTLGLKLFTLRASTEQDLEKAFADLTRLQADGLVIGNDPFFTTRSELLADLAIRQSLPAIYQYPDFAIAGGLMSYGGSLTDTYGKAGVYAGRILKGEKPADLPVQQSTKVELIFNLKTAKAFGITVPLSLLGRADEVIE